MNILLINHYAGSRRHGMEFRPFYLGREWVRQGHNVTIVAASQSHLRSEQPAVRGGITEENIGGIKYLWIRTPPYRGNGVGRVRNIFSFVTRVRWLASRLARQESPDLVIASSTYPLDIYPAERIANIAGARLVHEVHDLWPLTPMELGGMSAWHPFIMLLQRAENHAYRVADRVVSMLPKAESHMREHGMAAGKFVHVPNGVDVTEWTEARGELPEPHASLLARLRDEGKAIVGYAGSHGLANALDGLLDAAKLSAGEPVAFVLVGQGPEKTRLQQRAVAEGISGTFFLPPVPKDCVPRLLQAMDALYLGWSRRPIYRFGISPNKLLDYMMSGRPVIHAVDAGNDLVQESRCGVSCAPEDPGALAHAIYDLLSRPHDERTAMGLRGKDYVGRYHDYRALAIAFLESTTPA